MKQTAILAKNITAIKAGSEVEIPNDLCRLFEETPDIPSDNVRKVSKEEAARWAGQFSEPVIDRTFFIIGFSDGEYLRALLSVTNQTNMIYVFEPELTHLMYVLNNYDVSDVLESTRLFLCVRGINETDMNEYISGEVTYINYKLIMSGVLPGYEMYVKEYNEMQEMLKYSAELTDFEKVTEIFLAECSRKNLYLNLYDVLGQYSLNQLLKCAGEWNFSGIPAIIVSAGPSLDKNITELKKAEGKAFIIVVDTALKAVLRAGIKPDLTVCIDPRKETVFFAHDEIKNIPAVFGMDITADVIKKHCGKRFYIGSGKLDIANAFSRKFKNEDYEILNSGGSVANVAFSLAVKMGFKTIILIGQDLAFTDGKGHTKDAYDDDEKNSSDAANCPGICEVEDIYGNPVKTEVRMRSYIEWFENAIRYYNDVKVIDATEGGAKIHGTAIMKLNQAIEEECLGDVKGFTEKMHSLPAWFNGTEQQEFLKYMKEIPYNLDVLSQKIRYGTECYEELKRAVAFNQGNRIAGIMEQLKSVNALEDEEPLMSLVVKYCVEDKFDIQDNLHQSNADDINAVIDNAVILLKSYLKGIARMKNEITELAPAN